MSYAISSVSIFTAYTRTTAHGKGEFKKGAVTKGICKFISRRIGIHVHPLSLSSPITWYLVQNINTFYSSQTYRVKWHYSQSLYLIVKTTSICLHTQMQ